MKLYEGIASALIDEGCETMFGVMGDGNMTLWAAIGAQGRIDLRSARHEAAAVAMADGYFRATGKTGVATVTYGPGLTQTATSLIASLRNRTPLVLIVGDFARSDTTNIQHFDHAPFVESCGIRYLRASGLPNVAKEMAQAFHWARVRREPVVFGIPVDLLDASLDWGFDYVPASIGAEPPIASAPRDAIDALARRLMQARQAVLIAGLGARQAGAREPIRRLAAQAGCLLATTLKAKGLFSDDAFDLGIVGTYSSRPAEDLMAEADLVVGFGAELGYLTTEGGLLFPDAEVVLIDRVAVPEKLPFLSAEYIAGDACEAARALHEACSALGQAREGARNAQTLARLGQPYPAPALPTDGIDPRELARQLSGLIPADARVVVGVGHYWGFFMMYTALPHGVDALYSYQMGAIGQTLFIGLGAALAEPSRRHIVIDGDGSLLMSLQELETAARYRLPMTVLVWNDLGYGAEVHKLKAKGLDDSLARWSDTTDFAAVARAFGGDGAVVTRLDQFADAMRRSLASDSLFVIDVRVSPSIKTDAYLKLHFGIENQAPSLRKI
ncbi:MAG: thiamine pyrophosphate-binding protein [Burkholderiales bacterium]|nr:thiamine pyrophosphate-binding protein [Burkholderiales bacterium]